jgi:sec-independent protein translocase protein TatB
MSFGELAIVAIVGLVIFGPKELPKVLRKAGQWAGKLRRMAMDLRVQSGIDDALRVEGLHDPIREIQKLTRGELDGVVRATRLDTDAGRSEPSSQHEPPTMGDLRPMKSRSTSSGGYDDEPLDVLRDREVPTIGPDAYGALPDTAIVYVETLPRSALADEPLWAEGEDRPRPAPVVETTAAAPDDAEPTAEPSDAEAKVA